MKTELLITKNQIACSRNRFIVRQKSESEQEYPTQEGTKLTIHQAKTTAQQDMILEVD